MEGIYLLLGSNKGDRMAYINQASDLLSARVSVIKQSSVYESAPWGNVNQAWFLNQILSVHTEMSPDALMDYVLETENRMGRVRAEKWGSRIIDIDILFYHDLIIHQSQLTLPHPEIARRRFTLMPLAELASEQTHPVLQKTISTLLKECADPLLCRLHAPIAMKAKD